jgi:ABC-2 type transport system permease protein
VTVNGLRLYLRYIAISLRGQMQYKASFLLSTAGHLVATFIEFIGLWALFARFGGVRGWSLPEAAFLYGVVNISAAFGDAVSRGLDVMGDLVKQGDLDRLLLRPRSLLLQLVGHELTLRRIGRLVQGAAVLAWAAAALGLRWSPAAVALLVAAVASGLALWLGLLALQATLAFWTVESLEIMNTLTYGGIETAQYPLSIYNRAFRRFFIFVVPLACCSYFPVLAILGKADPLGSPSWLGWVTPVAGPLFLALATRIFAFGVRHYTSTGS